MGMGHPYLTSAGAAAFAPMIEPQCKIFLQKSLEIKSKGWNSVYDLLDGIKTGGYAV